MPGFKDLTGMRFGKLDVISLASRDRIAKWNVVCDCGNSRVYSTSVLNGGYKSCGCNQLISATRHGHYKNHKPTSTYKSWEAMKRRCTSPKDISYEWYGGRGISFCQEWNDFSIFLAEMGEAPPRHQIDRINSDGNYCKENCRWVTSKQNNRNKCSNRFIEHDGRKLTIAEWSEITGINQRTIAGRLDRGWCANDAFNKPIKIHQL